MLQAASISPSPLPTFQKLSKPLSQGHLPILLVFYCFSYLFYFIVPYSFISNNDNSNNNDNNDDNFTRCIYLANTGTFEHK